MPTGGAPSSARRRWVAPAVNTSHAASVRSTPNRRGVGVEHTGALKEVDYVDILYEAGHKIHEHLTVM